MAITLNGTTGITSPGGDSSAVDVTTPKVKNAGTLALEATGANVVTFSTNGSERGRFDGIGNLLIGATSSFSLGIPSIEVGGSNGNGIITVRRNTTNGAGHLFFNNPNGIVGTIVTNGSATAYNTSSDYRLKHDIAPMTGALARVAALKPCTYKWNADDSIDEGFIAHELQEVCPSAVSGEKDAVETYTDEDGVEQTRIKPQGIDTSFLVATLTAAIQEQQTLIQALTARIEALEQA